MLSSIQRLVVLSLLASCASARLQERSADAYFASGRYDAAIESLKPGLESQTSTGKDRLLYLLDLGLASHFSGRFEESTKYFLEADRISAEKDYTSLSQETSTLLVSDQNLDYKGEEFEKVLISLYLALNYTMMDMAEDALVEARRVNHKIGLYVREAKRDYKESAFARLLSAFLHEAEGDVNDAYIDYQSVQRLQPDLPRLGEKLMLLANRLGIPEDVTKWKTRYNITKNLSELKTENAELLVIFQNGRAPIKIEDPEWHQIPIFRPVYNPVKGAEVHIDGEPHAKAVLIDDIEATAISSLNQRLQGIRAKKIAGSVAKAGVGIAAARATDNKLLGYLVYAALAQADRADRRSWNWLPQRIEVAKLSLPAGRYHVELETKGRDERRLPPQTVTLKPKEKRIVLFRYAAQSGADRIGRPSD